MSEYRNMMRLAGWVADQNVTKYNQHDIECLVGEVGWEAADDFYEMIGWRFGADVKKIRRWIDEMAQEDE